MFVKSKTKRTLCEANEQFDKENRRKIILKLFEEDTDANKSKNEERIKKTNRI